MPPRMRHGFGTNRYYASPLASNCQKIRHRFEATGPADESSGQINQRTITSQEAKDERNYVPIADPYQRVGARALTSLEVTSYVARHAFAARGGMALGWL